MLLGLGRGPPGRGPPEEGSGPGRAPGRGPPGPPRPPRPGAEPGAAGPGAVRGVAPMPVAVELKGLLPGRGPGRGPGRWPGPAGAGGRAPVAGRGPGGASRLPGWAGLPCAGRGWAGLVSGVSGARVSRPNGSLGNGAGVTCGSRAAGCCATASGARPAGAAPAGAVSAATEPAADCAAGSVAARPFVACPSAAAATAAPSPTAFDWLANSSLSLRTTGASIVEDADRTNSPISWSLAMTALLSTPNSFASSYTRTFATALPLLGPEIRACQPAGAGRAPSGVSLCCSSPHAHRALMTSQPSFVRCPRLWTPSGTPRPCRPAGLPAGEGPAETPCGAGLAPSMPGSDADTHPGQAAWR